MDASLPVVPTSPCAGCHGRCCATHRVPVDGFELARLRRAVGGDWRALVDVDCARHPMFFGFRLDGSAEHWSLALRRHDDGACLFLDGSRCGVYAARPGACRSYPVAVENDAAVFATHAICPPERAEAWRARLAGDDAVFDDLADRELYRRALARWDLGARAAKKSADQFVTWIESLYDCIEPIRTGERGRWQLAAYAAIDAFPLP